MIVSHGSAGWSWGEWDSATLTPCRTLRPIDVHLPRVDSWQRQFGVRGIQFGSWDEPHDSCLNVDIIGLSDGLLSTESDRLYLVDDEYYFVRLDVRHRLPFADRSFHWVYSEHLIEHLHLEEGIRWLTEIRRILETGGLVRLTTPDLRRYLEAYFRDDGFLSRQRECLLDLGAPPGETPDRKAFMINQIFKFYGHRWIYDMAELRYALGGAGFPDADIVECAYQKGSIPNVARMDRAIRSGESIYVEARSRSIRK
ncbi:MAG: methyltransferase domain-containing protein [Spirochaetales bacterium]|nr:methyltransferase domain-containing protein [Spirochaetales bacterium]